MASNIRVALARNDGAKEIENVQALLAGKVGAVVAAPVNALVGLAQPAADDLVAGPTSAPSFRRPRPRS